MAEFENYDSTARGWMRSETFDLSPALARIDSAIFSTYARSFPFAFVPERQLLATSEYQALGTDGTTLLDERAIAVPEGYVRLPATAEAAKTLAARLPDADGFLWAQVTYKLLKKDEFEGTVYARMRADLTLTVYDRQGRAMLRHVAAGIDSTVLEIVTLGIMPASDFSAAAIRATALASADMARWLEDRAGALKRAGRGPCPAAGRASERVQLLQLEQVPHRRFHLDQLPRVRLHARSARFRAMARKVSLDIS